MSRVAANGLLPLHVRAERMLRKLIGRPEYADGTLLPDELTLANRLGVSRGTMRAALARLVQEGLLERRAGVGTRVRRRPAESGITAWRSFSREMARKGIRVENFLCTLSSTAAGPAARALRIPPRTRLWRLDRVRGWSGRPVLHARSWFHPRLKLTGREVFTRPLYEVLSAATGATADHAQEEFVAVVASAAMAELLSVKRGEPLLLRRHTVFDVGGRPMEYSEVHYVSSRFALTIDLKRETTE